MNLDEFKNHALFAGGIGAFIRIAVVKPTSVIAGILNLFIGALCSWFFSPILIHYLPKGDGGTLNDNWAGAGSFLIGFCAIWVLQYIVTLLNETKGNPFAIAVVIKNQIAGKKEEPPAPTTKNE